jgi:O-antigen ligase
MYILILTVPMLQSGGRQKPLWLLALLAGIAGLFVTFSRAAWLGGAAGGLFLALAILWHRPWRQAHGRTLALVGLAGGLLLGGLGWSQRSLLSARFSASGSDLELRSIDERAALNQAGRELVRLAPLTGVGANNATVALSPLVKGLPGVSAQPIHNLLLLVTAELGIGGGLLWLWLTVAPAWMTLGRLRQGTLSLWALGLAAALVAFAVIDLFDYYAWIWMSGRSWRWLLWGLWLVALRQGDSSRRPGG